MLRRALENIRILDFSQLVAGPACSMLLADMGAEVIKVEPPSGDLGRSLGPGWVGDDSALFHTCNRNKKGICLDLKTEHGVGVARRLAARADVLLESNRPGVMERLGLGPRELLAAHPGLIYCSVSAYGQQGPYSHRAGVDGILQADSGLMSLIGFPGAEPGKVQAPVVDIVTSHIATTAILAKLMQRARDGQGGHLDVNLMNAAISLQLPSIASYLSDGVAPVRAGSAAPYSAPNEAFETSDGWVMVAAYIGDRWQRLCRLMGHPEWIEDQRFATSALRVANRPAMRALLGEVFRGRSTAEWLTALEAEDILCARVASYQDLIEHPQLHANGALTTVDVPGFGTLRMPGFPINSREANALPHHRAPTLGEHTQEVLRGLDESPKGQAA